LGVHLGEEEHPFFAHGTWEEGMHTRVWQLQIRLGKLQEFQDFFDSFTRG